LHLARFSVHVFGLHISDEKLHQVRNKFHATFLAFLRKAFVMNVVRTFDILSAFWHDLGVPFRLYIFKMKLPSFTPLRMILRSMDLNSFPCGRKLFSLELTMVR
jgi:hypothetical protein